MPKVDLTAIERTNRTGYPPEYAKEVAGRWYRKLQGPLGFRDFGVSHVVLTPGAWSAQRHWHEGEDELVVMLEGEATLVDDTGRTRLRAGELAAFRKGDGNGPHLVNESGADCTYVAIGKLALSDCHYPDIDLHLTSDEARFRRKDGTAV